jgi:hypothetical protein
MPAFPFLGRVKVRDVANQFTLVSYTPELTFQGLVAGVDNLRPDIFLSPKFTTIARTHMASLIEQHGDVQHITQMSPLHPFGNSPYGRAHIKDEALNAPEADSPAQFKQSLSQLQIASLRRAHAANDIQLDLLFRVGLVKFLSTELGLQFANVLERFRDNLKKRDDHRLEQQQMALRDRFLRFQMSKRRILRRVADDLLATLAEVERETVVSTRQSLFGAREIAGYEVLANRLIFPDSAQDPFLRAEHYALFGSFDRDPDRYEALVVLAKSFFKDLGVASGDVEAEALLNVPENAKTLMFTGLADDSPRASAQRAITTAWMDALDDAGVMEYVVAAYETVPILGEYGNLVSPQQLKCALILRHELRRVEEVLETHNRCPSDKLLAAVQRVRSADKNVRLRCAARYLIDLSRFHRDMKKMEVLERALESVNIVSNDRLRELSQINGTLYEFLLPEEQQPAEQRVSRHVILKADIRDSSFLTRSLLDRGLNPASFFSLNFFEPVNKLLPLYGAEKVFIEGDAVILTLLENEGQRDFCVARTCVLAREILNVVGAYNSASTEKGLPPLEIGIGIAFQGTPPLYLMDGAHRIMISEALNQSDRLSACNKRTRRYVQDGSPLFNVFVFQLADAAAAAGVPEDFRLNYNVGGIHLPQTAFEKLREEISLESLQMDLRMPWGKEKVRLFRGLVPVRPGVFHPIVVREGRAAQVEIADFRFVRWADCLYYEVCTNADLLAAVEAQHAARATSQQG